MLVGRWIIPFTMLPFQWAIYVKTSGPVKCGDVEFSQEMHPSHETAWRCAWRLWHLPRRFHHRNSWGQGDSQDWQDWLCFVPRLIKVKVFWRKDLLICFWCVFFCVQKKVFFVVFCVRCLFDMGKNGTFPLQRSHFKGIWWHQVKNQWFGVSFLLFPFKTIVLPKAPLKLLLTYKYWKPFQEKSHPQDVKNKHICT